MKIKAVMLSTIFLFAIHAGYTQDSSALSKINKIPADTTAPAQVKKKHRARARVNDNSGISLPSTTSGTLNSSVNPNTQVVIPLGKNKKKKR